MKSKRSRKDRARRQCNGWTYVTMKTKKGQQELNLLMQELFCLHETSEAERKKALDECPTIGMFKVRKSFNPHESVEL